MRYDGKEIEDYSPEELIEIIKDYYLIRNYDSKKYNDILCSDLGDIRSEVSKLKNEFKTFDDIHRANIERKVDARNEYENANRSPTVGDFIILKSGECLRVTVDRYDGEFQAYGGGSYHLHDEGGFSYSGGCGDLFKSEKFTLAKEEKIGPFWFWHTLKGVGGGNGVHAKAYFRVFKENNNEPDKLI